MSTDLLSFEHPSVLLFDIKTGILLVSIVSLVLVARVVCS